ncbi:hypothetical protein HanIR_Chr08g0365771 [Helianthus annuus]|nr:hypothetical protein HanIR_Chr08g0365771 [Helianthus annuus]
MMMMIIGGDGFVDGLRDIRSGYELQFTHYYSNKVATSPRMKICNTFKSKSSEYSRP